MSKTLPVAAIKNGTVIDHIPAGFGLVIIRLLRLDLMMNQVTAGLKLKSKKLGKKDLIKIEGRKLTEKECQEIAIFSTGSTVNIIKDFQIEKKIKARLPDTIEKILICPNIHCITRFEPIPSTFFVEEHKHDVLLTCKYCEKTFDRDEIQEYQT
ncbi:MAG: aspartate carbamoyltransferase regulatory subunit [Simkaniaceae bacterium]